MQLEDIVVVTGGREWDNERVVYEALTTHTNPNTIVVEGECRGLDKQVAKVARRLGLTVDPMPAEWRKHIGYPDTTTECRCNEWRKAHSYCGFAGPRRNRQMLDKGPRLVLSFHHNLTESRGTRDCVDEAIRRGIPVMHHDGRSTYWLNGPDVTFSG
jgi:hypothetical protein